MAVCQTAGRMLPSALRHRLSPSLRGLLTALTGSDARSRAQRMALIVFAIRILSAAIAFVSQIFLARLMGEFEYGIFIFVWVMAVLFGNLSCLGLHAAVIRFLPEYSTTSALAQIRGLTTTARIFALLSASAFAAIGTAGLWLFGWAIEGYYLVPLYLGLVTLPMIALGDVMDGTARAHSWPVAAMSPTFIVRPLLILAFMILATVAGLPHDATTALTAALAATYVTTLGQFAAMVWRLDRHYDRGPMKIDLGRWLRVAIPVFLVDGFGFLLTNSDVVIVGLYLKPDEVAIYFAAAKTMALVHFVMFAVKAAAGPRFSAAMAAQDRHQLAEIAIESARWSFWPSLAIGCTVVLGGPALLSLFGPAFPAGAPLMAILLTGILAKAFVGPAETLLTMAGRQKLCVILYAAALGANVALNVTLIPLFGLTGAAGATAGAMFAEAAILHVAVRHTFGFTLLALAGARSGHDKNEAIKP
ncbi:polysaccharide biosynthesis associated protein [Sinorhizobium fredii USDA 205]|uniref:Oligosaccharide flippase family protein n=2 Tax=Rhizobium fredii TaxID=380 RepID=A0A844A4E5_RHIFR|nr:polysaccharide biosynthesis associated protein [Sinorhizobium fredii USDA 205]MQW97446.1 oligosaccharide flippase family protein [Sinorhizobium fredii]MQX07018.1 oligosaccharide flippase family protein [Sinorhizobium fredii]UTY50310.1 lipopolysaccharide biosynthesis protein [Sinorhizobium fredii]